MKKTSILFCIIILVISCQKSNKLKHTKNSVLFTDNDFETVIHLKSRELKEISDSLLFPATLIVNNDYLFINEVKSNNFIHAVNIPKDTYIGLFGNKGKGPGEILIPWAFSKSEDGLLRVLDPKQKKVVEFNVDSLLNKNKFKNEYSLGTNTQSASVSIYNNKIFYLNQNNTEHRLFEMNLNGKGLIGHGELLKKEKNISDLKHGELCLADMSNKKEVFVFSYRYIPLLEIFNLELNKWISIIGPENVMPTYKDFRSKTYHNVVRITDKFIYTLFNGKNMNEGLKSEHANIIYVFDYEGKLIKKLVLDKGIFVFDIYNDNIIYGIHNLDGMLPKVLKFEITQ